jgi:hypothetical protein
MRAIASASGTKTAQTLRPARMSFCRARLRGSERQMKAELRFTAVEE